MNSNSIPTLTQCCNTLGFDDGMKVHTACRSAEFRSEKSLLIRINLIKKIHPTITVNQLCQILGISPRKYYKAHRGDDVNVIKEKIPPPAQLLTEEEEIFIINSIFNAQCHNSCLTGKEVRDIASEVYKKRTGIDRDFSRDWCFNFCKRHQDRITKVKVSCVDEERASIDIAQVHQYIANIERILIDPPNPHLLMNFDETGFSKRPDKGKTKSVFICNDCEIKPYWRATVEQHHISLVAAITASCLSIRPLLLSTRKTFDQDLEETFFCRWGTCIYTPKGYMTQDSMLFWVKYHLAPYVKLIRDNIEGNKHCVIIADGCTAHFGPKIEQALNEIGDIEFIPIPSHSSHIVQMLDVSLFSALKRKYSTIFVDKAYSKFTQKLLKIKKACQSFSMRI
ncbi:putative transposase [Histomonas meleagridis]|uniref:putative transposase n=1 Tax=Histomonas meleagridis TaxID=135588 RepID=UPI00355AA9AA|nr:putative transposase [Histomonas meleagridis]KAH0796350.1 putative transposase [Histomonas meleagridis]